MPNLAAPNGRVDETLETAATSDNGSVLKPKRPARAAALLAITLLAGIGALVIFPTDSPVAAGSGIPVIVVGGNGIPSDMQISLAPYDAGTGTVVTAEMRSSNPTSIRTWLEMELPDSAVGGLHKCPHGASCQYFPTIGRTEVTWAFSPWRKDAFSQYTAHRRVEVPTVGYTVRSNNEYAQGSLPEVVYSYWNGKTSVNYQNYLPLAIRLSIPNANSYTWASGSAPTLGPNYASWLFAVPPSSAQAESGVNLSVQNRDAKDLFIAGALLGIAGAALIGVIQELVKS